MLSLVDINGKPTFINGDIYSSYFCCSNPCYSWNRPNPQTIWPCNGLAQMYSVSGGEFKSLIPGGASLYKLTGSINVTAVPDFRGLWEGSGGSFFIGSPFSPEQPFEEVGTGIAEIRGPFTSFSSQGPSCYWDLSIGYRSNDGFGALGLVRRFKEYIPGSKSGPEGTYDADRSDLTGAATVS
jgi:hypothetical protein